MIRKSALTASIAALLTPAMAGALGLGNIEVTSALNEPLQARIPLRGADPGQLEDLRVALADDQQFERAGLDRVYVLTKLKFEVVETGGSGGYIRISTREPVSEPFLNFLVDVNWPRGRVLREYTVLLDPPVYGSAISTGTGRTVTTVDSAPPVARSAPAPAVTPPPAATTPAPAPAVSAPTRAAPRYTGDSYGPVRRGETLWAIADRTRHEGVSIQRMMLALLRANPEAFSLDNVNALRTGVVLRIPSASEITVGRAEAFQELRRQHALWAEYRQSATAAPSPQPDAAAPAAPAAAAPATSGTTTAPAASGTAAAGETSAELKLVGAGTTGAATGGGADVDALRNELTMAQEEADAAKRENEELQSRLAEVESLVGDLQRLVELKEDQLAALQDQLAKASEAAAAAPPTPPAAQQPPAGAMTSGSSETPAPETAPPPQAAAETPPPKAAEQPPKAAAQPPPAAQKPRRMPPPPPPPKTLLDEIQSYLPVPLWTVLAALGGLLVAFGGWRFARGRKAKANAEAAGVPAVADGESMIEQYARTEMPVDGDDDVTELPEAPAAGAATMIDDDDDAGAMAATARSEAASPPDDEDPLAEVNVYLAYERFDQAEHLVRDAIATYPERHDYKLKLLEVFYAAKNLAAFEVAAGELRDAVGDDHEMMQQAREWWSDLGAGRELFAGEDGPPGHDSTQPAAPAGDDLFDVTASESGDGEETGVDFDLGFDTEGTDDGEASRVDFDLGGDDESSEKRDSSLDFDLGSLGGAAAVAGAAAAGAAAAASTSEVDFDLGGDDDTPTTAGTPEPGDTGLDFDLGDTGTVAEDDAVRDSDTGLDFELPGDAPVSPDDVTVAGPGSLPERAVASQGDDALDFDLGGDEASPAEVEGAGTDSLDFDLGDTGTLAADEASDAATLHDAAGEESGLDFDLGDTQTVDPQVPRAGEGTAGDPDSVLDFDLGDTGAAADADPDSVLDFDLGDTGTAAAADPDSVLDFDLGDTGPPTEPAAPDSELDFDLGDTASGDDATTAGSGEPAATGDLDFDLGDTASSVGAATGADAGEPEELDFDLGDTLQTTAAPAAGLGTDDDAGSEVDFDLGDTIGHGAGVMSTDSGSELDFDLGDTFSDVGTSSGGEDAPLDLDLGVGTSDDALDLNLDDTVAGGSSELDLTLEADDGNEGASLDVAGGDDSLPVLDMELEPDDDSSPDFDTVKLAPEAAASILDDDAGEQPGSGSELNVDTEFQGIFSDAEGGDDKTGSGSVLDFDLGSADLGAGADDEGTGLSDVESTQFMLQDVMPDDGAEDEDDHTLVLGRGASGEVDEIQTKLDLAQAYMDMGDTEGARNLLGEVMADGDDPQKAQAGEMLKKLS